MAYLSDAFLSRPTLLFLMSEAPSPFDLPPSLDDLAQLADVAFQALPADIRQLVGEIIFRVDDFAAPEVLAEMGIEDPFELTGLYFGAPLGQQSVLDPSPEPARIFLYRRPLLDEWVERGDISLFALVNHVLVHEIGHHFGLSDQDMDQLEAASDAE